MQPTVEPQSSKRLVKRILTLIILLVIAAAGLWLWLKFQTPSEGRIKSTTPEESVATEPELGYKTLDGKFVRFEYNDKYQTQPPLKTDTNSLEQHYLFILTPFSKHFTVAVEKLPHGDLAENSSFKLRQTYPDKYKIEELALPNAKGKLTSNKAVTEKVAFIVKDDLSATIALTSAGGSDDLDQEMSQVLASFEWK